MSQENRNKVKEFSKSVTDLVNAYLEEGLLSWVEIIGTLEMIKLEVNENFLLSQEDEDL